MKANLPKVSIITPSYNQGKYIERTIWSVAEQRKTYPNLEHIVVDGNSKDNTLEVLQKYNATVRWISEPDKGFAEAVNKGLAMATGEIIGIQSSDDLYTENAVGRAVEALLKHPEVGMVFGHFAIVDQDDNILSLGSAFPQFTLEKYLALDFVIPQPSAFFRKEVVKTVGDFDLSVDYTADMEFWLRLAAHFPAISIPESLSYVRVHPEARNTTSSRFGKDWLKAIEKNLKQGKLNLNPQLKKMVQSAAYLFDANFEARNGRRRDSFKQLWRATTTAPVWVIKNRRKRLFSTVSHLLLPPFLINRTKKIRTGFRRKWHKLEKVSFDSQFANLSHPVKTETESVICDLCGEKNYKLLFQGRDYRFGSQELYPVVQCSSCDLIYLNPRPTEQAILKLYENEYTPNGQPIADSKLKHKLRKMFYNWKQYYFSSLPHNQKVLDIGCGRGELLEVLKERECEVNGVEINSKAASLGQRKGLNILVGTLEQARYSNDFFDSVIMSQILEHLPSPHETIQEIWRILKPGGRLFIYCPNVESYFARMFGKYWHGWHIPFHFNNFSEKTLLKLAQKTGFHAEIDSVTPVGWLTVSLKGFLYGEKKERPLEKGWIFENAIFKSLLFPIIRLADFLLKGRGDCLRATLTKQHIKDD